MANDLGDALRQFVAQRADYRCEYCLIHDEDSYSPHQVDHIISRKHGGGSEPENLAYSCVRCNAWKGSDVGSTNHKTRQFIGLFHPRQHCWTDHFALVGFVVEPLTPEGEATARLLRFNLDKRVVERQLLIAVGRYPR